MRIIQLEINFYFNLLVKESDPMQKEVKLKWILIANLFTNIGMSFIWPLTSVYLHDRLGISLSIIGIVLFCNSFASVLGSLVAGVLFDRLNRYRLFMAGGIGAILPLSFLIFFHGWPAYPFLLVGLGFANGWNKTLLNSIGASLRSYDGRYVFNMIYFVNNLGMVMGTAMVGFIFNTSVALLFVIAAVLYVIYLVIAVRSFQPINQAHLPASTLVKEKITLAPKNKALIYSLYAALFFAWIMYQQWISNLSVYMTDNGLRLSQYSLLWTINGIVIILVQLFLVKFASLLKNIMFQIFGGLVMLALSFIFLIFAKNYGYYVLAMIVLSLGEATAFPAIPTVVSQLAPKKAQGRYLGLANSFISAGQAIGPLFGGLVIDHASYKALFIVAALTNLLLASAFLFIGKLTGPIEEEI